MATSSTLPAVKAALVDLLSTALATSSVDGGQVPVFYAWQPDVTDESVFLGRPLFSADETIVSDSTIESNVPTIKAGRKQRQEEYEIEGTAWSFRGDLTPSAAAQAELRGFELADAVDDVLADDPTLGLTSIQYAVLARRQAQIRAYGSGWVSVVFFTVAVKSRLT